MTRVPEGWRWVSRTRRVDSGRAAVGGEFMSVGAVRRCTSTGNGALQALGIGSAGAILQTILVHPTGDPGDGTDGRVGVEPGRRCLDGGAERGEAIISAQMTRGPAGALVGDRQP